LHDCDRKLLAPRIARVVRDRQKRPRGGRSAPPRLVRLAAIDSAATLEALNQPGFDFHALRGRRPRRYSIHVNGPWCITFEWREGRALRVDLEQYH
jgi:plasmid maintenance system killer protein